MIEGKNFIGTATSTENADYLQSVNPKTREKLSEHFHKASQEEINQAAEKAHRAFLAYRDVSGEQKADFLEAIAEEIMELGDELIERAMQESGLPQGRLEGERGRTTGQLQMFADLLREGSWVDARIDHAGDGSPDLRNMLLPLGPVAVFGASNFPLAFSTAGGDTASALAAGCPVIVKSHESHLGTNELVSRAILKAADKTGMPEGVYSSLNGGAQVGSELVQHPDISAVGFTGSYNAGTAIHDTVQQRDEPIPVYAEMGSVNPMFLLEDKLSEQTAEVAEQCAGSVTLSGGQFCTNPGLLVGIESESLEQFKQELSQKLKDSDAACMLNEGIAQNYRSKREDMLQKSEIDVLVSPEEGEGNNGTAALAVVSAADFLKSDELQDEVFGPFTLIISCKNDEERQQVAEQLHGQLTVSIIGNEDEITQQEKLVGQCREKAGRVIFNGVPTGVRVSPAMQHGGPFPATTDSKFTSVGTGAIRRFVRPIAFQDSPQSLLPDELKDGNPLDINRIVDSEHTK